MQLTEYLGSYNGHDNDWVKRKEMKYLVIYSRLFVHGTSKSCACHSDQSPPSIVMDYKGTSAVSQTSIHFAILMASTEHLVMKLEKNILSTKVAAKIENSSLKYLD